MNKITNLEANILYFINDFCLKNGYAPTVREVAEGCFISTSVAHKYLWRLYDKHLISMQEHKSRSIVIKEQMLPKKILH